MEGSILKQSNSPARYPQLNPSTPDHVGHSTIAFSCSSSGSASDDRRSRCLFKLDWSLSSRDWLMNRKRQRDDGPSQANIDLLAKKATTRSGIEREAWGSWEYPPEFYDRLSKISLNRRALRNSTDAPVLGALIPFLQPVPALVFSLAPHAPKT
ncbi:uncharacterized protein FMAN_15407 [Fusarium mangiferae]|uniref:Uncharacterized protein n=1 Tax=Fusarium mangiferae TaxID=192010 RepID=A0A1L7UEI1_FUSMA|nr:uncharacterized protein FMAN_15407 [Fusarium mangiferae]CVL09058.1 uncharacterized protein FMAN_15407 [Fusarium mangiferae]